MKRKHLRFSLHRVLNERSFENKCVKFYMEMLHKTCGSFKIFDTNMLKVAQGLFLVWVLWTFSGAPDTGGLLTGSEFGRSQDTQRLPSP